jgi:hypothetical protein
MPQSPPRDSQGRFIPTGPRVNWIDDRVVELEFFHDNTNWKFTIQKGERSWTSHYTLMISYQERNWSFDNIGQLSECDISNRVRFDTQPANWLQYLVASWCLGRDRHGARLFLDNFPREVTGRIAQLLLELYWKFSSVCPRCTWRLDENEEHYSHITCLGCSERMPVGNWVSRTLDIRRNAEQGNEVLEICYRCFTNGDYLDTLDLITCEACDELQTADQALGEGNMCWECFQERNVFCEEGDHYVSPEYILEETNSCGQCLRDSGLLGRIHSWDYRPDLIFYPDIPQDKAEPLYIGMELEMSWPDVSSYVQQQWIGSLPGDLIYCKSDSSVHYGFEAVTHPMQPKWALKNFPFELFQTAINKGCLPTESSTGTHIHMNKEAFSPTLMWKLLQVHYRLPDFIGVIGGRGVNARYGRLKDQPSDPRHLVLSSGIAAQRSALMEIVKKKGGIHDFDRYVALNLRNEYTIEMRYMRGGIAPAEIKKNIEWAQCLYDFIRRITVADVHEGAIDDPGFLLDFIYTGNYPNLAEWIRPTMPQPKRLKERAL